MSDQEVVELMITLIQMSDEHFNDCINYVENTEMPPEVHKFLSLALELAGKERAVHKKAV